MRPKRGLNANRPTDRAIMPTIYRPNDRANTPAIYRPTNRRALRLTTIITRCLHRTTTRINKLCADTPAVPITIVLIRLRPIR